MKAVSKVVFGLAFVLGLSSEAFAIRIQLNPATQFPTVFNGQPVVAVGRSGLFLDSNLSAPAHFQSSDPPTAFQGHVVTANNFTFSDVTLDIDDLSGIGRITGTIFNNANAADVYALEMNLTGMCVRNGSSCTAKTSLPSLDLRTFLQDPNNARNSVLGIDLNTGFEWSNVSLRVTNLPGGPSPSYTGVENFIGWTMYPLHNNPVELHIWSNSPGPGNLYFKAWYQALNLFHQRIGVGDTKSFGVLLPPTPQPIPEPSALLLFSAAGLGLLRKKNRKA